MHTRINLLSASEIRISGKMQCSRHLVKCQICFMKMFMIYVLGLLLLLLYIEDIKSVIQNTLYANPDKKVWRELSNNIDH